MTQTIAEPQAESARAPRMPGALPLLGHALTMFRDPLKFFQAVGRKGGIVRIKLGTKEAYVVSNHDILYDIFVRKAHDFEKGKQYDLARDLLGNGILLSEGDFHRSQRLVMQPAFHHSRVGGYVDVMRTCAADMFAGWEVGQPVEVYESFYRLAVQIVIKTLFTTDMADSDIAEVHRSMPEVIHGIEKRVAIPPAILDRIPSRANRRFFAAIARLRSIGARIVDDYRARDTAPSDDLMKLLLDARGADNTPLPDDQIHNEFMTFLTAGSETTPSAMSWTCYLLGRHPEVQERARQEIDEVLGGREITVEDLPRLTYLRQVVTESLRMYPPVWAVDRRNTTEVDLGGYRLPERSEILYSIYGVHHDEAIYPNSHIFDPERWSPANHGSIPRSAFLPFGAGKRNCIGESFAWAEIQTVFATLLAGWVIKPVNDAPVKPIAMGALVPGPLPMIFHRRTDL